MQKKVLLIRFSALGDLVLTTGPMKLLREAHPTHQIDLLTSEIGEELYLNNPNLDNIFVVPKGTKLMTLIKFYRQFDDYDFIIDWQDNFRSRFLKFFIKGQFFRINKQPKKRRIFVKNRKYKEDLQKHVVEKYYDVLIKAFSMGSREVERLRPWLSPNPLTFKKDIFDFSKAIVLNPYASQKNKEWAGFKDLSDRLIQNGENVVIVGSSDEQIDWPESEQLINLTNRTTLRELSSLLANAKALISTDSGPMHIGIAVSAPTLALFGPTTKEFGFYPKFKNTEVMERQELDCRPCHIHGGNTCPLEHHNCMKLIEVEDVLEGLKKITL